MRFKFEFIERIKRRKQARKEHENIQELYYLPFNEELQDRLKYKKLRLIDDLMEHLQLDKKNFVDIINTEKMIEKGMENGMIDMFYNKVYK